MKQVEVESDRSSDATDENFLISRICHKGLGENSDWKVVTEVAGKCRMLEIDISADETVVTFVLSLPSIPSTKSRRHPIYSR